MLAIQVQHGATACIHSICINTHIHTYTNICMYFHIYIYIHVYMHIHSARLSSNSTYLGVVVIRAQHGATTRLHSTYTNTHTHTYTYVRVCMYIYTYTHSTRLSSHSTYMGVMPCNSSVTRCEK